MLLKTMYEWFFNGLVTHSKLYLTEQTNFFNAMFVFAMNFL